MAEPRIDAFLQTVTSCIPGTRLAARPYRCNIDGRAIRTRTGKVATYASLDQACKAGKAALRKLEKLARAPQTISLTVDQGRHLRNTLENFRAAHRSAGSCATALAEGAYESSLDDMRLLASLLPG